MKRFLLTLTMCVMGLLSVHAQTRFVSGKISAKDEGALPGVSVVVKDTRTGVITDAAGTYKVSIPDGANTLIISFIGYTTQEIPIGNRTTIDVEMLADVRALQEVVVTAFGVQKQVKSLGYGVQEVKGSSLTESRSSNVVNGLSGKVAGLRVSSNGGPGSGSTIQIRGSSSVSGNNQPLVVVDGVPIQQSFDKRYGSGISEVNPDNIKEISILKGPNAAALYGSRAANGVIIITTKNGAGTKGIGVEVNSNITFERPWIKPQFQNTYGGGNGYRTWYTDGWSGTITDPTEITQYRAAYGPNAPLSGTEGTDESWGAPMDGRPVRHWWSGKEVAPLTPNPNNWEDFWQTGQSITNNVAVSGGNDKGNFRLSVGRLDQKGIMYYNDFYRNNFKFNSGYNFTSKFSATISAEYIKSGGNRSYSSGQEFIWSHRQTDWTKLRNWRDYTGVHIQRAVANKPADTDPPNWQHTFFTNPYYLAELLPNKNEKDRLVGNIALNYKITPYLTLMARSGTDVWTDTRIVINNFERVRNGNRTPGSFSEEVLRRQETNHDAILTFNKNIGADFTTNIQVGGIQRTNYYKRNFINVGELVVDGLYNVSNSNPSRNTSESRIEKSQVNSVFGSAEFGYKNALFLNATARNDWSSTLPSNNRSYFYPSVSASAVVTDLLNVQSSILSFGKLRASWAQVGSDADPYKLMQTFRASSASWAGSIPEFYENTEIANSSLKPEITTGTELGLDLRFLKGRVGLDVTYYSQVSRNQILGVEISKASGYNTRILNAGEITNKGLEVVLTGTPVKLANGFSWETTVNFSRNRNKVVSLAEGLTTYVLNTRQGLNTEARVGMPYGTFFGSGFEHAPDGQIIYGANGYPVVSSTPRVLGNIQPKWTGGFMNTFNYKGISLMALIDVKWGGDFFDEGTGTARWTGQYAETGIGREEGVIGKGVVNIGTKESPNYVPNTTIVPAKNLYAYNNPRSYHEAAIFDGSYVKLREVSLGYTLPVSLLGRLGVRSAKVSLVGRNVLMLFKNNPHIDPEVDRFGSNQQGFAYGELPSSRSLGANLSFSF